ncbi:MAG: GHMP kinase [Desulfitobacteriaceae bacterium]
METTVGYARCPGTCGEWIQGAKEGIPFLVDCPIDRFSEVAVKLSPQLQNNLIWTIPAMKTKVARALKLLSQEKALHNLRGEVLISSGLPLSKGMASSTADIVAAVAATLLSLGETPTPEILAYWALRIEPSDSVMFPGITEMSHVYGSYHQVLGPTVPAQFLALDWGGEVDTIHFNARQDLSSHYRRYEKTIQKALSSIRQGVESADLELLAYGATISARCNQDINPKIMFENFHSWVRKQGGLGVLAAHSGSLLAGVFPPEQTLWQLIPEAELCFNPAFIDIFKAHDGGAQWSKISSQHPRMVANNGG